MLPRVIVHTEVSVILSPALVGGTSSRSFYVAPDLPSADTVIPLRLASMEKAEGDFVRLRYAVGKTS
jgi:hypothetical protein